MKLGFLSSIKPPAEFFTFIKPGIILESTLGNGDKRPPKIKAKNIEDINRKDRNLYCLLFLSAWYINLKYN